jgi:hypothetical protein
MCCTQRNSKVVMVRRLICRKYRLEVVGQSDENLVMGSGFRTILVD